MAESHRIRPFSYDSDQIQVETYWYTILQWQMHTGTDHVAIIPILLGTDLDPMMAEADKKRLFRYNR